MNLVSNTPKIYHTDQTNSKESKVIIRKTAPLVIFMAFQLCLFTACSPFRKGNELTKFKSLQFSFQDPANSRYFSVLFSQSDTVFLKKYFRLKNDSVFYSILPDSARSVINKFVININSSAFHPSKPDSIEDFNPSKAKFSVYIDYPDENQHVNFHSLHPPLAFNNFNSWINRIIKNLRFNFADTSINFKEDKNILEVMNK
jgi:hypothetical protein